MMGYLFQQVWLWCLLSFLLGSLLTWLIMRAARKPHVEVSEERIHEPGRIERPAESGLAADTTARTRSDVDSGRRVMTDADDAQRNMGATAAGATAAGRSMTPSPEKATTGGSSMRIVEPGPYPGSARPNADGSAPSGEFTVKGSMNSRQYHTADSPSYRNMRAEVWFRTPADAERAGFVAWNRNPKQARR